MKNTSFKVEDIIGDVVNKDKNSQDQIIKLIIFFSQNDVNIKINIKFNFFKSRTKNNFDIEPSAPPYFE